MSTEQPVPEPLPEEPVDDLPKRVIEFLRERKRATLLEIAAALRPDPKTSDLIAQGVIYAADPQRLAVRDLAAVGPEAILERQEFHGRVLSVIQTLRRMEIVGVSLANPYWALSMQPADCVYWLIPDMSDPQAVIDFLT